MNKIYKIIKKCLLCGKLFERYICSHGKYCSLSHAYLYRTLIGYLRTKMEMDKLSISTKAWLAGFWEGEGNLTIRPNYRNYNLSISQNEKKVIYFIKRLIPSGVVYTRKCKNTMMTTFILHGIGSSLAFIESILPYVHSKKRTRIINNFLNNTKIKGFKKHVK